MPVICPSCGFENAEGSRFCSSCGTALADAAAPVRRERKFATALFADLVGSTALAEHEDPEVVQSLVGRAFDRLAGEIERYGGLLEKFMGDAVLAVFGVPHAHEDDPERAVRAALELQAVLSELNRGFAAEGRPTLQMRVGVEAGEVLVDLERAAGPRDRMLTGDAVNTASRLQSAAEPGRVVVGPSAYAATKDVIDYRELEPLELKGKAQPVPAWDALRVKARRRGERAPLGLEARLVGRDEELAVLKQTLHRVEQEGRPGLVTVLGNAGVGKSRLTWELLKYAEGLPEIVYWRKGRCLAYGNVSYSALAEAVKAQCEILEDDPPEAAGRKADDAVLELFGDLEVAQHVRMLVGAPTDRTYAREELFDAWRRFLERLAARYPLVLVLEDIHWADEGLLDFVDHLADWGQGPIFVLTMARPELLELRPHWGGGKRNYSAIFLDPLTSEECQALIDDLLSSALSPEVRSLIAERSEGNPLYAEEIVRMFIDRGVLRATESKRWEQALAIDEVEIPRSIQGLIAARLDSLPGEEKSLLQDAAVVGRAFWLGSVARLAGLEADAARAVLGRLRVKEIVIPREPPTFSGELELAFRHVLIRDVAYESLPKSTRASKHVEAARWAEERAGERSEEIAELLATHHLAAVGYLDELGGEEAARTERAREAYSWARTAGDRAGRLGQPTEAARWYRSALDLTAGLAVGPGEMADLWLRHGNALFGVGQVPEMRAAYETSLRYALEADDPASAGRAEVRLVFAAFTAGDDEGALRYAEQALAHLEPLGDSEELADALHSLGWFQWRRGHLAEAEQPLRRSEEIAKRVGSDGVLAAALSTLGLVMNHTGRGAEGLAMIEEGFRIAKEIGDLQLMLRNYNNLPSTLHDVAPDPERGRRILTEGLELARKAGVRDSEAWLLGGLADEYDDAGELERAEGLAREAVEVAGAIGNPVLVGLRTGTLALILVARGKTEEAAQLVEEAVASESVDPEPQARIPLYVAESRLARAHGDLDLEVARLREGIAYAGDAEMNMVEVLHLELIRRLVRSEPAEAASALERLQRSASVRGAVVPYALVARGLTATDPAEAVARLEEAAAEFERLDEKIELARALLDLARARAAAGGDPRPDAERAVKLLRECDAQLYLPEAEAALAGLDASGS
jgi:class 3 adenylate cyclase/tetratricopeptide (TPR) repeat protein